MDFFQLKSDRRYLHTPVITNLNSIVLRRKEMDIEYANKVPDISVGFSRSMHRPDYIDVLDTQLFLVCDGIKKVFTMYKPSMIFKTICIVNNLDGSSCNYNAPLFSKVECMPDCYKAIKDRKKLNHLILLKKEIEDECIFKIANIDSEIIIIRLDVAESILRRGIKKFQLEKVELE